MQKSSIKKFDNLKTPFYLYDAELLRKTLESAKREADKYGYMIHYAIKANANPKILKIISSYGFGADCVSGNEILAALESGFDRKKIVFAGVGKTDVEINIALDNDIFCFNVESMPELEAINRLAEDKNKIATIALRVNPNVDAHTHHKITTGLDENKFGFNLGDIEAAIAKINAYKNLKFIGLHFHIGSQIMDFSVLEKLCKEINEIKKNLKLSYINVGGGLGIDYQNPLENPIPDFEKYFEVFAKNLTVTDGQIIHFEPGRSIVGQMGTLISRVTYVKESGSKKFVILDAGMNDLVRPAMYDAYHKIENLSSEGPFETYDVVGPICESSDVFQKDARLAETKRGDFIAIYSAGAYGKVMASGYNLRDMVEEYLVEDLK